MAVVKVTGCPAALVVVRVTVMVVWGTVGTMMAVPLEMPVPVTRGMTGRVPVEIGRTDEVVLFLELEIELTEDEEVLVLGVLEGEIVERTVKVETRALLMLDIVEVEEELVSGGA